jgi:hypothetical protein
MQKTGAPGHLDHYNFVWWILSMEVAKYAKFLISRTSAAVGYHPLSAVRADYLAFRWLATVLQSLWHSVIVLKNCHQLHRFVGKTLFPELSCFIL